MIPEIGHFALILAFTLSFLQIVLPLFGIYQKKDHWMRLARPISIAQCFFVSFSFLILMYSFYSDDFTLAYVAKHSNSILPNIYKIGAVWGGHEGSLLLWLFILSLWTLSVGARGRHLSLTFIACHLVILGLISVCFIGLLLFTSNPFLRLLPNFPLEGNDLNPLLQDFGLMIHPPILYLGYVGFAVPFAFAVTTLLLGKIDNQWVHWVRPYTLCAFSFITLGIALGSWWAYYELGWGGWWFWDPVENASFMPWLLAIALIHSLIISDKRQSFLGLTIFLAILVFAFALLGTFLVRSGIVTSVHSFASDPQRGILLLQFLGFFIGGSFVLYAVQAKRLFKPSQFTLLSRESLIFITICLLLVATFSILLGTMFPLFAEILLNKKISVGFPYFNMIFIPLMIPLLILIPFGPFAKWGGNHWQTLSTHLKWPGFLSVVLTLILPFLFVYSEVKALFLPVVEVFTELTRSSVSYVQKGLHFFNALKEPLLLLFGLFLGIWVSIGTLQRLIFKLKNDHWRSISLGALGMCVAHFGMGIMVLGIVVVSYFQIERDVKIFPKSTYNLGDYAITLQAIKRHEGTNFVGYQGHFSIEQKGKWIGNLWPEKRIFVASQNVMTETAIHPHFFRDIYIALGEKLGQDDKARIKENAAQRDSNKGRNQEFAWSVRLYYKPFIRWIWLGAILVAIGSFLAALAKGRSRNVTFKRIK